MWLDMRYFRLISYPKAIVPLSVSEGIFTYLFIYIRAYRLPEWSIHKKSFAFTRSYSWQFLELFNFVDLRWTVLFEIELFDDLTVCKQIVI